MISENNYINDDDFKQMAAEKEEQKDGPGLTDYVLMIS